jgi:hypothetical protein
VVPERAKEGGLASPASCLGDINVRFIRGENRSPSPHRTSRPPASISFTPTPSGPQSIPPISKMSFFDDFTGLNSGYPFTEYNSFESYCFGTNDEQFPNITSQGNVFESDTTIAGPSGSPDWFLDSSLEGNTGKPRYQGSTLLWGSEDQFVEPYAFGMEPAYDFGTSELRRCRSELLKPTLTAALDVDVCSSNAFTQQTHIPIGHVDPSVAGQATTPSQNLPTLCPPVIYNDPISPSPVPTKSSTCEFSNGFNPDSSIHPCDQTHHFRTPCTSLIVPSKAAGTSNRWPAQARQGGGPIQPHP